MDDKGISFLNGNLLGDVTRIAHEAATAAYGQKSYVSPFTVELLLKGIAPQAVRRTQYSTEKNPEERTRLVNDGFRSLTDAIKNGTRINGVPTKALEPEQMNHLSRLVALDSLIANAVNSAERAKHYRSVPPKEQFKTFLTEYLKSATDQEEALTRLKDRVNNLLISLTHTMHPTIYHSPEARLFEAELTRILENPDHLLTGGIGLNAKGKDEVTALFSKPLSGGRGFMEQLARGKAGITPKRPMTVSLETQGERFNLERIRAQVKAVTEAWNAAVKEAAPQHQASLQIPDGAFQFRTWGQSADADGREKSTSEFLYASIQKNCEGNAYKGPILDIRQNAKHVHLPYMNALVQIKERNSEERNNEDPEKNRPARYENDDQRKAENNGVPFAEFYAQFMRGKEEKYQTIKANSNGNGNGNGDNGVPSWPGAEFATIQHLDDGDRAKILTEIIQRGYRLLPDQLRTDTLDFNRTLYPVRKAFLEKYKPYIEAAGLDPATIEYNEMIRVTVPFQLDNPGGPMVALRPLWDAEVQRHGFQILHNGLQYNRLLNQGVKHPEQSLVHNFLQGTKRAVPGNTELVDLTEQERATFNDTAKRLFVLNDAIEKYGEGKVATRYQIANFSAASDFLVLLKFFQDTGIAVIKDGAVKSSKLAIQPLLETGEDLKKAADIFKALLENPLAKSFWQARNNEAEIMLGFSDGAASVGNFASQWEIYRATQQLTALFSEHGIKVRFFQGRGRGVDRGGSIVPSLQMDLLSPEAMARGIYDVTLQSDLPMDLASSDDYGKDYFTKIILGTLNASLSASKRVEALKTPEMAQMEQDIQWIADHSAKIYQEVVRTDDPQGALRVMNKAPDNPNKTSRVAIRGGAKESKVFDDVRAIPKEYLLNGMDLQAHNVGLKQALDEFREKFGDKRLGALNTHPYFKAITQTIRAGLAHYDPAIARAQAKAIGAEDFVEKVIPHLDGLAGKIDYITGAIAKPLKAEKSHHRPSWSNALDQIAHAIIVTGLEEKDTSGKPVNTAKPVVSRPDQKLWADTLYNALFVTAQEVGHRELPRTQETQHALAG